MHRSAFAGLTVPDPDDSALGVDNGSFATSNPDVIDYFLRIGAVSHRHNAHPGVADPVRPPSASVIPSGGMIGSDQELYFGYTVVDTQGGETRLSEVVNVTTDPGMGDIEIAPAVDFDSSAGVLPAGDYGYAVTIMDAGGGESTIGPTADDTRPPGYASGQMLVSGLAAALVNPGDRWRLWRADNGGDFNLIGVGVDDTFTDYGIDPVDQAASPPYDSTSTASTNLVELTLPTDSLEAVLADPNVAQINVYLSVDGDFVTPSLYARLPIASAGAVLDIGSIDVVAGSPPSVSRSVPGAHQIDPDTELVDWHWKRPVASAGALPSSGNASGDVRVAEDTAIAYIWSNGAWQAWTGGGGGIETWDSGKSYHANDIVIYYSQPAWLSTSNIYQAVQDNTGQDPSSDTAGTYWRPLILGPGLSSWQLVGTAAQIGVIGGQAQPFDGTWQDFNTASGGAATIDVADASGNVAAAYRQDENGRVTCRGSVTGGAVPSLIFPWETGFAPAVSERFVVSASGGVAVVEADADGLHALSGDASKIDLSGVDFYTS